MIGAERQGSDWSNQWQAFPNHFSCSITRLTPGVPQSVSCADSPSVAALASPKGFSAVVFDSLAFSSAG